MSMPLFLSGDVEEQGMCSRPRDDAIIAREVGEPCVFVFHVLNNILNCSYIHSLCA